MLGKVGWLGALAAARRSEPFALEERLHALERREFLRRERRSPVAGERQYAFRHVLVRDVAYGQLPAGGPGRQAPAGGRVAGGAGAGPGRGPGRAARPPLAGRPRVRHGGRAGHRRAGRAGPGWPCGRPATGPWTSTPSRPPPAGTRPALELWPAGDPERPRLLLRLGQGPLYAEQAGGELLAEARDGLLAQGDREGAAEAEALLGQLAVHGRARASASLAHARRAVAAARRGRAVARQGLVLASLAGCLMPARRSAGGDPGRPAGAGHGRALGLEASGRGRSTPSASRGSSAATPAASPTSSRPSPSRSRPTRRTARGQPTATWPSCVITLGELDRGFELQARGPPRPPSGSGSPTSSAGSGRAGPPGLLAGPLGCRRGADEFIAETEAGRPISWKTPAGRSGAASAWPAATWPARSATPRRASSSAGSKERREAAPAALALHARALLAAGRVEEADARADELLALLADQRPAGDQPGLVGSAGHRPPRPRPGGRAGRAGRRGQHRRPRGCRRRPPWPPGDFDQAADLYAEIGSLPDEAFARLRAAERLLAAGRRADADAQLQRALAFYRKVGATAHLRKAEALLTATA